MKRNAFIKPADIMVILIALGITGGAAFWAYFKPKNTTQVSIRGQGRQEWVFPLDAEETVKVRGPLGITVVRIHGNEAWVESSPCLNQICVAAGHVNAHGNGMVACLPNDVLLLIQGNDESANTPDSVAW